MIVHRNGVLHSLESVPTIAQVEHHARQLHERLRVLFDDEEERDP